MPVVNVRIMSVRMNERPVRVPMRVRLPPIPLKSVFMLMMLVMPV